ncbi:hypothetical protein RYJ27_09840 [Microbacterium limosum]|uniref:Uncharacterized protein n=1 Tax=Microbacterium limosum TaxID=3079935 RepID=A0AAU0MEM3_9MICO|nr:hypothetical protein [Microbacterium sp. Y20]WOQ69003.1 hypothetical protein RYJ27_09840 [Microbacterium sp. Y20]
MRLRTTSTQRTYRYVRLSLVGAIVLLGVAFAAVSVAQGPPASLSAAFYTPARDVFVGAVFAVSLALLALSGRSVEQALLDYAAILAPLIAIVPTPLAAGDVPGLASSCPDTAPCVPSAFLPGIAVGVTALVVVGSAGVVTAVVLALVQGTCSRGFVLAASGAGVLVVAVALWALLDAEGFVRGAHLAAAVAFFGLIAVVAALAAFAPAGARARRRPCAVLGRRRRHRDHGAGAARGHRRGARGCGSRGNGGGARRPRRGGRGARALRRFLGGADPGTVGRPRSGGGRPGIVREPSR